MTDYVFLCVSYVFYLGYGFCFIVGNTNHAIQIAPKTIDGLKNIDIPKQTLYGMFLSLSGTTADIE